MNCPTCDDTMDRPASFIRKNQRFDVRSCFTCGTRVESPRRLPGAAPFPNSPERLAARHAYELAAAAVAADGGRHFCESGPSACAINAARTIVGLRPQDGADSSAAAGRTAGYRFDQDGNLTAVTRCGDVFHTQLTDSKSYV